MRLDAIGFGALNIDKLYRVNRMASKGEESYIRGYNESPGGSAANTIVGLAKLGLKVGYIGKVSKDREGEVLLKSFRDDNINTNGVVVSTEGRSGVAIGFFDDNGDRSLYIDPGVNNTLDYKEINLNYAREADFIHLTSFVGERPFKAQKKLVKDISGIEMSFDPGELYARKNFGSLIPIIKRMHVIFPNENELKLLTGKSYKDGSKILIKYGVRIVATKLGSRGCYVTDGKEEYLIEPYQVKVVDTTGAGDAYCAGFLYGLIENKDLYTCGKLGNFVASCSIRCVGARQGLPRRSDLIRI